MGRIHFLLIFCSLSLNPIRSVLVFFVKAGVAALEADFITGDPHIFNVGADVKNVAIDRDECGFFFCGERAKAIGHAEHLGGVQGKAAQGSFSR